MDNNRNLQEQELVRLLGSMKSATPDYPENRLMKRRAAFLASASAMTVGGLVAAKVASEHAGTLLKSTMSQVDKAILAVEVLAVTGLTAYVGMTAYIHRDALRNLLFPPPVSTSVSTESPSAAPVIPTATPVGTGTATFVPTGTLAPGVEPVQPTQEPIGPTQAAPTAQPPTDPPPPPPTEPPPTKPGLHLGQTRTPDP